MRPDIVQSTPPNVRDQATEKGVRNWEYGYD